MSITERVGVACQHDTTIEEIILGIKAHFPCIYQAEDIKYHGPPIDLSLVEDDFNGQYIRLSKESMRLKKAIDELSLGIR